MAVLLATLRPAGVAGDQSDATFDTSNDDGADGPFALTSSWVPLEHWPGGGTVEFLRVFLRASYDLLEQGPAAPDAGPAWRLGSGPHMHSSLATLISPGVVREVGSGDQPLAPNDEPWTPTNVSMLQLALAAVTYSQGTHEITFLNRHEMRVEVWGTAAAPGPGGQDVILAAPVRSGAVRAGLRGGDVRAELAVKTLGGALKTGDITGPGGPA